MNWEAHDEKFDYYAEKAINEAAEKYEELIETSEETVRDAVNSLDSMIQYLDQLNTSLHQLLEANSKIMLSCRVSLNLPFPYSEERFTTEKILIPTPGAMPKQKRES